MSINFDSPWGLATKSIPKRIARNVVTWVSVLAILIFSIIGIIEYPHYVAMVVGAIVFVQGSTWLIEEDR